MRAIKWALPALGLCCFSSTAPAQAAAYVLGDSLGLGVATVSKLTNLWKISIHIRGNKMQEQITRTPPGSTVFLTLGTNDANGSIAKLDKSIDDLVQAFEKRNITVVWLGPPCVKQSWDNRARELDAILAKRFENTSVRYVSMRDDVMCSWTFHERDGVHLKMKGYAYMWEKARMAAGFEAPAAEPTTVASVSQSASKPSSRSKKSGRIPLPVPRPQP